MLPNTLLIQVSVETPIPTRNALAGFLRAIKPALLARWSVSRCYWSDSTPRR
jgi:hypothetical protein